MRFRLIRERQELADVVERWDGLLERAPSADVFVTPTWTLSWLDTFWKNRELFFSAVVDEGGELLLLAPLLWDADGSLGCSDAATLPINGHTQRSDIVIDEGLAPAELGGALRVWIRGMASAGVRRLNLERVPASSRFLTAVEAHVSELPRHVLRQPVHGSLGIRVEGSWDDYLESLDRNVRHNLRRTVRRARREHEVTLEVARSMHDLGAAYHEVLSIEEASWKHEAGSSLLRDPGAEGFYRDVLRRGAASDWSRVYVLRADGVAVGHMLGLIYRGCFYPFKTSYRTGWRSISPGAVLHALGFEAAVRDGDFDSVDLLGGVEPFKRRIANRCVEQVHACVFDTRLSRCGRCTGRARVAESARRHAPALIELKRKLQSSRP